MTRPESYDDTPPVNRCGTCRHCHYIRYHEDLLCFHGDEITARRDGLGPWDKSDVELLSRPRYDESVELLEGEEYSKVWAARVVDAHAVCEKWEAREKGGA